MPNRTRLDLELVNRGLVPSRSAARHEIDAGRVLVDGVVADKASRTVGPDQRLELTDTAGRWVSRAGAKLAHALDEFGIDLAGLRVLDAGSSTGGFTDCALQRGAAAVIAVDVGTDQLHPQLRADPRVEVREQTDVRSLGPADPDRPVDAVVADLSFISLRLVLPALAAVAAGGPLIVLIKPQFEAGRAEVARGRGVIKDPVVRRRALDQVMSAAQAEGLALRAITVSPIRGGQGNVEFAAWLQARGHTLDAVGSEGCADMAHRLDAVMVDAETSGL